MRDCSGASGFSEICSEGYACMVQDDGGVVCMSIIESCDCGLSNAGQIKFC